MGSRVVAVLGGVCLVAVLAVMWFAFPASVRESFKLVEILTLLLFLVGALVMLYGIARTSVTYDDSRVRIRNGFRDHELAWTEVDQMWMQRGMPWATLHTGDGRRVLVMAVQGSDGDRAAAQLRQMRARAIEAGGLPGGQGSGAAR
jgi:hypothetical protein